MLLVRGGTPNGIGWGKTLRIGSNTSAPVLSFNGLSQDPDASNFLQTTNATVWSMPANSSLGTPIVSNVGGLELDWGYWNQANIRVSTSTNGTTSVSAPSDGLWAVFRPANMQSLTGQVSYYSDSENDAPYILVADYDGDATPTVQMGFQVDLAGGATAITNGELTVQAGDQFWSALFSGSLLGAYAKMQILPGDGTLQIGTNPATNITSSRLGGAFIGTSVPSSPAFLGGFTLEAGSEAVQGLILVQPGSAP